MSSNINEFSKFNSNLPVECKLFKFLAKGLSPLSVHKIILLQGCKNKRNIYSKRDVFNAYDRLLIFILTTFGNFFELLKKSIKTYDDLEYKIFLDYLEIFEEYTRFKLKDTRKMIAEREKIIKLILNNNKRNKIKHQRLFMQLTRRTSKFNELCSLSMNKLSVIDRRQQKFKRFMTNKLKDDIYDGNMRIVLRSKIRKDAEQNSNFVQKHTQNKYQNLLETNILQQKNLVEQKLKAEQTLKAILQKFDSNVGSRVAEIESIEGDINDYKQKFENWKLLIAQQEANYVVLKKEKEEEELQYRNQKLDELRNNHAAKVIQLGWKKYKVKKRKARNQNKTKQPKKNTLKRTR